MGRKSHARGSHRRGRSNHGRASRSQRPTLVGTLRVTGSGVARVETPEGTFRISKHGQREAMNGDTVGIALHRARGGEERAVVVTVVERGVKQFVGVFHWADPLGVVTPLDSRIRHDFFVLPGDVTPKIHGVRPGDVVAARIEEYPSRAEAGVVTIERRIGTEDALDLGIECVMASYDLVEAYPEPALEEAEDLVLNVEAALADPLRRDLRDRFVATIDPFDARDFDDAISLERTADGGYRLGVHIADVSHYVAWGSSIDLAARDRATSVYLADRVLPMLPERLSCDLCSLNPLEDRLAMTVDMELDARGEVRSFEAYPSVIRSRLRLDYGEADRILAGEKVALVHMPEGAAPDDEVVAELLACANELAEKRVARRHARGAIDFNTVEVRAVLDDDGRPTGIAARSRTAATGLIEEAMLLANECVAEKLVGARVDAAFRVHEPPTPESLAAAAETLAEVGAVERAQIPAIQGGSRHAIEEAVEQSAGSPLEPLVNALLLRSMQRALYKPQNEGHYALGAAAYCHFTSPIRRYPDLIVHRALKLELAREHLGRAGAKEREEHLVGRGGECMLQILPQLCRHSSDQERRADAAAHASQKVKIAQYYQDRIGERCAGTVCWLSELGVFVRLDENCVEGLVPVRSLGGNEYWEFDAQRLRMTGTSSGRRIDLGQRAIVEVAAADPVRGHLDFKLVHLVGTLH